MVGGGLFLSPTVMKKSPTPKEKSPTVISKRCWTLEYSGELEFSSPFMEQWTLDARGVLHKSGTGVTILLFYIEQLAHHLAHVRGRGVPWAGEVFRR